LGPLNCGAFGKKILLADLNEDGFDDLIIGDLQAQPGASTFAGQVSVLFGRADVPPNWVVNWILFEPDLKFFIDLPDARLGADLAVGDFDGDGHVDLLISSPSYNTPGAVYLVRGPLPLSIGAVRNFATDPPDLLIVSAGNVGDSMGFSIALADVNSDGKADLLAGAPDDNVGESHGKVYLIFGRELTGESQLLMLVNDPTHVEVISDNSENIQRLGAAVGLADLTGDGRADLLVSDSFFMIGPAAPGMLSMIDGTRLQHGAIFDLPNGAADLSIIGVGNWWYCFEQFTVSPGPSESEPVLLFSAPSATYGANENAGEVFQLNHDDLAGESLIQLSGIKPPAVFYGDNWYFYLGRTLLAADLDQSGLPELIIGADGGEETLGPGGEYVVFFDYLNLSPADDDTADDDTTPDDDTVDDDVTPDDDVTDDDNTPDDDTAPDDDTTADDDTIVDDDLADDDNADDDSTDNDFANDDTSDDDSNSSVDDDDDTNGDNGCGC